MKLNTKSRNRPINIQSILQKCQCDSMEKVIFAISSAVAIGHWTSILRKKKKRTIDPEVTPYA